MAHKPSNAAPDFPASRHLTDTAAPPTARALADLECLIGANLPDDYRRFLLAYNGGNCDPWLMLDPDLVVAFFHGIREDSDSLNLAEAIEWGREAEDADPMAGDGGTDPLPRLPSETIPIAEGPDGHKQFCLAITGQDAGSVWLCDTGIEPAAGYDGSLASASHMQRIADSFAEFLKGLKPYQHSEPKPEGVDKVIAADSAAVLAAYLDSGHPPDETDHRGRSLVYRAAQHDAIACFRLLLDRGASGREALKDACSFGRIAMVRELLARGERPRLFHRMAAAGGKHTEILRLLDQAMTPPSGG